MQSIITHTTIRWVWQPGKYHINIATATRSTTKAIISIFQCHCLYMPLLMIDDDINADTRLLAIVIDYFLIVLFLITMSD